LSESRLNQLNNTASRLTVVRKTIVNIIQAAWDHTKNGLGAVAVFSLIGASFTFLSQIILARTLSIENFGHFGSVLSQAILISSLAGAGVYFVWLRKLSDDSAGINWITSGIWLAVSSTVILLFGFGVWGFTIDGTMHSLIYFLIGTEIAARAATELNTGASQVSNQKIHFALYLSLPSIVRLLTLSVGATIVLVMGGSISLLTASFLHFISCAVIVIVSFFCVRHFMYQRSSMYSFNTTEKAVNLLSFSTEAFPYTMSSFLLAVQNNLPIVIAANLLSFTDASHLIAANSIVMVGYVAIGLVYRKYYQPMMFKLFIHDPKKYVAFIKSGFMMAFFFGVLLSIFIAVFGTVLMVPLYGLSFEFSITLVQILSGTVLFRCLINHSNVAFVTSRDANTKMLVQLTSLLVTMPLVFVFARTLGVIGIAWCLLSVDCVQALILRLISWRVGTRTRSQSIDTFR
jgi:O-antigen/teichoic acid export membrane protein